MHMHGAVSERFHNSQNSNGIKYKASHHMKFLSIDEVHAGFH